MQDSTALLINRKHKQHVIYLRKTLDLAVEIGELLIAKKKTMPHGDWEGWVKANLVFSKRTAEEYMSFAINTEAQDIARRKKVGWTIAMRAYRDGQKAVKQWNHEEEVRAAAREARDTSYIVHHADCRRFAWPDQVQAIVLDPPWHEIKWYRWGATFAQKHLADDGIMFVQCCTDDIYRVSAEMEGLNHVWTCALVYYHSGSIKAVGTFLSTWRPVLIMSRGKIDCRGRTKINDALHCTTANTLHHWQQPVKAYMMWLSSLTRPGDTIADPFACVGTLGVACKRIGARTYIGCEIEAKNVELAKGNIWLAKEGSYGED